MSQQPPDDVSPPPPDARPGDTWSLDDRSTPGRSQPLPPAPGEPPLPVVQGELTDLGVTPPGRTAGRSFTVLGVVLTLVLIVAGGAGAAAFLMLRGSGEVILDKVPADADVVVVGYLDPAASQKVNLFRMASRFPALGDQAHLRDQLNSALDDALSDIGMDHSDLAWVGSEVGFYAEVHGSNDATYALLIAADDADAAGAFVESYERGTEQRFGTTYHTVDHDGVEVTVPVGGSSGPPSVAIVDGVVVVGSTEAAVDDAIDTAHGGSSIADDPGFQNVTAALPDAKLGMAFVDPAHLIESLGGELASAGVTTGLTNLSALDGIGVALSAEPDGLALDTVAKYDDAKLTEGQRSALSTPDHANPLLVAVPADALGVYAVEHMDLSIQDSIDRITSTAPDAAQQLDQLGLTGPNGLLSQLTGDVAVEARTQQGSMPFGGAVLVGTNDPEATRAWLDRTLRQLPVGGMTFVPTKDGDIRPVRHEVKWVTEQRGDTAITYASGADVPIAYAVVGGVAVIATSPEQIDAILQSSSSGAAGSISGDPGFTSAIASVPTSDGVLYLDVPAILESVRHQVPPEISAGWDAEVGKNLAPIEAVVAGSENGPDEQRGRLLIRIP